VSEQKERGERESRVEITSLISNGEEKSKKTAQHGWGWVVFLLFFCFPSVLGSWFLGLGWAAKVF